MISRDLSEKNCDERTQECMDERTNPWTDRRVGGNSGLDNMYQPVL